MDGVRMLVKYWGVIPTLSCLLSRRRMLASAFVEVVDVGCLCQRGVLARRFAWVACFGRERSRDSGRVG